MNFKLIIAILSIVSIVSAQNCVVNLDASAPEVEKCGSANAKCTSLTTAMAALKAAAATQECQQAGAVELNIEKGEYKGELNRDRNVEMPYYGKNFVTIISCSAVRECIFDAEGKGRIFAFFAQTPQAGKLVQLSVTGLVIKNGKGVNEGAGIAIGHGLNVAINECIFEGNVAKAKGGGLASESPTALNGVSFIKNVVTNELMDNRSRHVRKRDDKLAAGGGGAYFHVQGDVSMSNVVFDGNSVLGSVGGGVWIWGTPDSGKKESLTFTKNLALAGGAMYLEEDNEAGDNPPTNYVNCLFTNNTGLEQGAVYVRHSAGAIFQSPVFESNVAGIGEGGALAVEESSILVKDGIFLKNEANLRGGAISISQAFHSLSGDIATTFTGNLKFENNKLGNISAISYNVYCDGSVVWPHETPPSGIECTSSCINAQGLSACPRKPPPGNGSPGSDGWIWVLVIFMLAGVGGGVAFAVYRLRKSGYLRRGAYQSI